MSLFPEGFDPRSEPVFNLDLANINTPDGDFGFIIGDNGKFEDRSGKVWWGSQLITKGDDEFALNGIAPSGSVTLSFFQDPEAPDLVKQVRALGSEYVKDRPLTFYIQPLLSQAEFYDTNRRFDPLPIMTRTMRKITYSLGEAQDRAISLSYESAFENRKGARRLVYNTEDHAKLIGAANPSLEFIPTIDWQEEKLFG